MGDFVVEFLFEEIDVNGELFCLLSNVLMSEREDSLWTGWFECSARSSSILISWDLVLRPAAAASETLACGMSMSAVYRLNSLLVHAPAKLD